MLKIVIGSLLTAFFAVIAPQPADAELIFADVTTAGSTTFSGTLDGVDFTGTYSGFGGYNNTSDTSNFFSQSGTFTPALAASDSLGILSQSGFTITFASAVNGLTFDIYSLANTLNFGSAVTLVSGGADNYGGVSIAVSGDDVIGQAANSGADASGTFSLSGPITTLTVSAVGSPINDGAAFIFGTQAVPEPSSLALCGLAGLIGTGYAWRRRRRAATA